MNIGAKLAGINNKNKILVFNSGVSLLFKLGNIIVSFLLIKVSLNLLNQNDYGVWLTLNSLVSWVLLFDFGIANGIKNDLTKNFIEQNFSSIKKKLSDAYGISIIIFTAIFILLTAISFFISWDFFFNTEIDNNTITYAFIIILFCSCFKFILNIISSVFQAIQRYSYFDVVQFIAQLVAFLPIWYLSTYRKGNLVEISFYNSFFPLIILLLATMYFFTIYLPKIKPNFKLFKFSDSKQILKLSFSYLLIQLSVVIILSTDNIIIAKFFSPADVTTYNLCYKYFWLCVIISSSFMNPYWSLVTASFYKKDLQWLRKSLKYFFCLIVALSIFLVLQIYFAKDFFLLWIGESVIIPTRLSILMGIYMLMLSWNGIITTFLYGTNRIKLQLYLYSSIILINIPLSIFLIKILKMGIEAVVISNIFCLSILVIILSFQVVKVLNYKDKGIFSQ